MSHAGEGAELGTDINSGRGGVQPLSPLPKPRASDARCSSGLALLTDSALGTAGCSGRC